MGRGVHKLIIGRPFLLLYNGGGRRILGMWENIGNIASIATLVLFVFYFIGRWWCITIEKKDLYEKIDIQVVDEEEDLNIIDVNGEEIIKMTSEKYLNWIKFYDAIWNGKKSIKKGTLIKKIKNINRNESMYFKISIPDGIPNTIIEYQRSDYIKGRFIVRSDGRGTGYHASDFKLKTTFRSWMYYMLK